MADTKLSHSNMPISNYNVAVVSHCPSQQTATIVLVKKPSVLSRIFNNFGISTADSKDEKTSVECTRYSNTTFFVLFVIVFFLFLCGVAVFFVMWFTTMYNDSIISSLVLRHNSIAEKWWKDPPIDAELRLYLFNYTNAERYMKGEDKKLRVEELGPYVYIEKFGKVNVTYNANYTITYRENRTFTFAPEKSKGHQYDQLFLPNIPLLTASSVLRHQSTFNQIMANGVLMGIKPFTNVTAHEFIWGYEDKILKLRNQFSLSTDENDTFKDNKFGMLKSRNGTSQDVITVNSGEDDIRKLALIDRFNGQEKMNFWSTDECNRLDGTDGSQFPPHWMNKKRPLQVFIKAFCRKFPLIYEEEVNILNGIPAWRYKAPQNVFAHPDNNTANSCYCNTQTNDCPPSGIFNATLCFGAPIFASFPHFYTGAPKLFENIEGLQPDEKKHVTYADVHPRLAFPIAGASRFQINVQVHKAYMLTGMNPLTEGQYLPVLWMEVTAGELSDELRATIYHSTFSLNAIELSLRYGSLLVTATTTALLVAACYYNRKISELLQKNQVTY